ncbi:hypothetical protein ACJ3XI_04925 [Litorimonas sp. RW-G-Af-16]
MLASPAFAQSQKTDIRPLANQIVGKELPSHFRNKTHDGAYNFSRDGKARSFYTETHLDNGDTQYREGDLVSKGIWFTKTDAICYAYENPGMTGGCFRVYRVKNCYYYYSTQMARRDDELDRDYWVARSTLSGEAPECEAAIS